ncbi:Thioredoxin-like fold,Alkyl hydroperoxide reductase subunit C/ Thiol specific [Cinara cedri]|uniref:thioredoxin-dependent peroxiredoxin n=1 Tax=Cinara cedri TaxID=506608 RepID=A0A5E4MNE7_9HEMI|nr:Thioredoxin-like fold,Alkyl hydroperoxide reductase subunit C/ Thiol specific [Cinara cedri]
MSQFRYVFNPPSQGFHTKWLDFVGFRSWLAPVHGDKTKAWCNICGRMFRADLKVLRAHGVSRIHSRKTVTPSRKPDEDYTQVLKKKKTNKSIIESATFSPDETNTSEEIKTFEMEKQSQHGKYVVVSPNANDGPHSSSSDTQYVQKDVNVIDKSSNLVSVDTEHYAQKNEGNADDIAVVLQTEKYHSSSHNKKTDQKHDGIKHKAIVSKPAPFWKATAVVNGYVTELNLNDFKGTCSVDSYYSHQTWYRELQSNGRYAMPELPLLSDPTHAISKTYGCYLPELGHSLRAHYIIDTRGILRHVTINDLNVGRNIREILRLIEAFQYTDGNERLCPANWNPEKLTL